MFKALSGGLPYILGFLKKGGTRLQLIRSSTLALCIFLYMRINLWVGKPNYCEYTRLYFYFIDMALDDGKCWWAFSQILRLCSHTVLFFQQINWLMLTGYAVVHCGPEYVWVLIAGARHLHPRFCISLMKNSQIYVFQAPLKYVIFQLSRLSLLIIVPLNIEPHIHSGNCIDWMWRYKALPFIDVSQDALNLLFNYAFSVCLHILMA